MFDHDSDGFVDREDLKDMLASLGIALLHSIETHQTRISTSTSDLNRTKSNGRIY
jgi:Ca2+-binding EF-hand superfamily protein